VANTDFFRQIGLLVALERAEQIHVLLDARAFTKVNIWRTSVPAEAGPSLWGLSLPDHVGDVFHFSFPIFLL
jgi:hypothetical protein